MRPVMIFFILAFAISWTGAWLFHPTTKMDGLMLFPIMLLGPSLSGILLTARWEGRAGVRGLFRRLFRAQAGWRIWTIALFLPPIMILLTLWLLTWWVSPIYAPNHFYIGLLFGILAGVVEEIGWTGVALPALRQRFTITSAGVILGICWGVWHLPVIDYLGAAYPHKEWLPYYFLAFILLMTAMRVLMARIYDATGSGLPIILMHASSTGALAALGPSPLSAGRETFWYLIYAMVIWAIVGGSVLVKAIRRTA